MQANADSQRRRFLQMMGSAPLLPLAGTLGASSAALLTACGGSDSATPTASMAA